MHKTIREWIDDMPEHLQLIFMMEILKQNKTNILDDIVSNTSRALIDYIGWYKTEQGEEFWLNLYKMYNNNEKLKGL